MRMIIIQITADPEITVPHTVFKISSSLDIQFSLLILRKELFLSAIPQ